MGEEPTKATADSIVAATMRSDLWIGMRNE